VSNPSPSRSGVRPLWLTVYMLSIGLLIGLVVSSSMGVLRRSGETAVLFSCGFLSMLAYYRFYRRRPEIFASAVLIGLAMVVFSANDLVSAWFPRLETIVPFVWYELLSPILLMFIAALYPTFHRRCRGSASEAR
jgi:hypothetical protein